MIGSVEDLFNKLQMLSDPNRLKLIFLLCEGEKHVGQLCAESGRDRPTVSRNLRLMQEMGWVKVRRLKKYVYFRLSTAVDEMWTQERALRFTAGSCEVRIKGSD